VDFDWMTPSISAGATRASATRLAMYRREVAERAAIFYRLGYTQDQATARLQANADWDFEVGASRPDELDADAIGQIVATAFARRPAY
jgi:hypothetical protein